MDILLARDDYHFFCVIAAGCAGIRSTNHRSLTSPGREDWFIPDFDRAKYLHLDVHINVRLGGKFNKRYPFYSYGDIHHWDMMSFGSCSVPVVSPEDEARITLSRIAFRAAKTPWGSWQKLTGDWAQELNDLLFAPTATREKIISYHVGSERRCRVKKSDGEVWVHRQDLAGIRRFVRVRCGAAWYSIFADPVKNTFRACSYFASRVMNRAFPGSVVDRRLPTSGGIVVAVVAPDGMGKTTQVKRMTEIFGWKFNSTSLYLGSGDGKGWWIRRLIRTLYIRRRSSITKTFLSDAPPTKESHSLTPSLGSYLLGPCGLPTAL